MFKATQKKQASLMLFFSFENLGLSVRLGALLALVPLTPFSHKGRRSFMESMSIKTNRKHILPEVGELYGGGFRVEIQATQLRQILIFYMIHLSVN